MAKSEPVEQHFGLGPAVSWAIGKTRAGGSRLGRPTVTIGARFGGIESGPRSLIQPVCPSRVDSDVDCLTSEEDAIVSPRRSGINGGAVADIQLPADVREWLRSVFRACNERITGKLSNQPNAPEPSFDMTWIEHLSEYATPLTLTSSWTVRVETHYVGGLRHFQNWEIADIGVLLFIKLGGGPVRSKVALLRSKRLYPTNMQVEEETRSDFEVGMARLADPETLNHSIASEAVFEFTDECRYGAIIPGSDQVKAISRYEKNSKLRVYYQLYNPWRLPFSQRVPLTKYALPDGDLSLGVRIAPAQLIHAMLKGGKTNRPKLRDLASSGALPDTYGWPLETFIADEFLTCREGDVFESLNEARMFNLFNRRSGAIFAAIAITIEGPNVAA